MRTENKYKNILEEVNKFIKVTIMKGLTETICTFRGYSWKTRLNVLKRRF
jgi:hypothetical protein